MFLYEGDCLKNVTVIHGVRYVTVSHYGGDVEIRNKMAELIKRDFRSSELDKLTNETSVGLDIQAAQGVTDLLKQIFNENIR